MKDHMKPSPAGTPAASRNRRAPENQREQRRFFTLWIPRAFSDKNYRKRLFDKRNNGPYGDQDIADFLKLPDIRIVHSKTGAHLRSQMRAQKMEVFRKMESRRHQLEAEPTRNCFSPIARQNFDTLSSFLKLNTTERAILEFFVSASLTTVFSDAFRVMGNEYSQNMSGFLSRVLKIPPRS